VIQRFTGRTEDVQKACRSRKSPFEKSNSPVDVTRVIVLLQGLVTSPSRKTWACCVQNRRQYDDGGSLGYRCEWTYRTRSPLYSLLYVSGIQILGPSSSSAYTCCYWELLNEQLLYTEYVDRRGVASLLEMPRRVSNARTLRRTTGDVLEWRTALLSRWTCYTRGCCSNWSILVQKEICSVEKCCW